MWLLHGFIDPSDAERASEKVARVTAAAVGFPNAQVDVLETGALSTIATDVSAAIEADVVVDEALNDPARAAAAAMAHHRLLCEVVADVDVLPMRLGAVAPSGEAGRALLVDRAAKLRRQFERVRGAAEFAIRVSASTAPAKSPTTATSDATLSGRDYLSRRLAQRRGRTERATLVDGFVGSLAEKAGTIARDMIQRPLTAQATEKRRLIDLALLTPRSEIHALERLVETTSCEAEALGLSLEAIGPWPPFHFADEHFTHEIEQGDDASRNPTSERAA